MPLSPERKFVWAPDMKALGDRVNAAEKAAAEARDLFGELEDRDDIVQRIVYLAAHVRDTERGRVTPDELQQACDKALDGLELADAVWDSVRRAT
jgi:hypothetical protein